jgi:hypothetical protein
MFTHAALDEAIARTGVHRYRWLCSDENPILEGPSGRHAFQRLVTELAAGTYTGQRFDPATPPKPGGCCNGSGYPPERDEG